MDQNEEIREVLPEFLKLERITGSEIENAMLTFFEKKGIDIRNLRVNDMMGHSMHNQKILV